MTEYLPTLVFLAGFGQLSVLTASALVPVRLNWRSEFQKLPHLHQQMYWIYGGYVVLSIIALGTICLINPAELTSGTTLAKSVCVYMAAFWGIRLALQAVLDVSDYLTAWWLIAGEVILTTLFVYFTTVFAMVAIIT